jgi:hypothetical protein
MLAANAHVKEGRLMSLAIESISSTIFHRAELLSSRKEEQEKREKKTFTICADNFVHFLCLLRVGLLFCHRPSLVFSSMLTSITHYFDGAMKGRREK